MSSRFLPKLLVSPAIAAAVLCGTILGAVTISSTASTAGSISAIPVNLTVGVEPQPSSIELGARNAAIRFVAELTSQKPDVWRFAPEDDQDGMSDEQEAVGAFTEAYPPLANAADVSVDHVAVTGNSETVAVYVKDKAGLEWLASLVLSQDDAGDWKLLDCEIQPAPGSMV